VTAVAFSDRIFSDRLLWTFPCNSAKEPLTKHGFKDAVQGVFWPRAPLVGVPTGKRNGFDVLDIDGDAGRAWYDLNFDAIPRTRAHSTRRGLHLLFVHSPGLRCSTGSKKNGIAPGIDVRSDGGFAIYWPRQGLPIEDAPLSEWPDWLLQEAMRVPRLKVSLSKSISPQHDVVVLDRTEALRELDPYVWNGKHDEWFELLMGCKAAGIDCEDFVEWITGDPHYADDADIIRVKWDSVEPKHAGAFFAALKAQGIKLHQHHHNRHILAEVHHSAPSSAISPGEGRTQASCQSALPHSRPHSLATFPPERTKLIQGCGGLCR
jgi:Bifunctional DNA primase/polymerase, N-terminal